MSTPAASHVDTAQAIEFFKMLYGKEIPADSAIELRIKSSDTIRRRFIQSFDALDFNGLDSRAHIWYGVSLRKADATRGTLRDLTSCPAVWADCDRLTESEREEGVSRLLAFECPPTAILMSGGGLHVIWKLSRPLDMRMPEQAQLLREVVHGLAHELAGIGADPTVHDPSRVLRVPGTFNAGNGRDKIYDPPREVEILHLDRDTTSDIEELGRFRKSVHAPSQPQTSIIATANGQLPAPVAVKVQKKWKTLIRDGWSAGCGYASRSELDTAAMLALLKAGHTEQEIAATFMDPANGIGAKAREKGADGPRYLAVTLEAAREWLAKGEAETPTLKLEDGMMKAYRPQRYVWDVIYTKPIVPLARLRGATNAWLVRVAAESPVTLDSEALSSARQLKRTLPPTGSWTGSDNDAQALIPYFESHNVPEKTSVDTIGLHGDRVVFPNAILGPSGVEAEPTLVYSGQYRAANLREIDDWPSLARAIGDVLLKLHQPGAIHAIAGWFLATFSAPQIRKLTSRGFPLLNVWGSTGSGKTTLLSLLWRMTGSTREPISIQGGTDFSRTMNLSATNTLPMVFDEHRTGPGQGRFYATLREAFQEEEHERGRADLSVMRRLLTAPVAVAGESALPDPALRQRALIAKLSPDRLGALEPPSPMRIAKATFERLSLEDFNGGFYANVRKKDPAALWQEEAARLARVTKLGTDERKQFGPIAALVGLRLFEDYLPSFNADEAAAAIAQTAGDEEEPSPVDQIVITLFSLVQKRELRSDQDVKLDGDSLFLNPSLVLHKLAMHLSRERSDGPASKDALREALRLEYQQNAGQKIVRKMRAGKRLGGVSEKAIELSVTEIEGAVGITREQWDTALDLTRPNLDSYNTTPRVA